MCFAAASNAAGSAAAPTSASSLSEAKPAATPSETPEDGAANAKTAAESLRGVRATIHHMVSTVRLLQPGVASVWKRAFVVDMLVTVRVSVASFLLLAVSMTHTSSLGNCLGRDVTLQYNTTCKKTAVVPASPESIIIRSFFSYPFSWICFTVLLSVRSKSLYPLACSVCCCKCHNISVCQRIMTCLFFLSAACQS